MDTYTPPSILSSVEGYENINTTDSGGYNKKAESNLYALAQQKNLTIDQQTQMFDAIQQNILDKNNDVQKKSGSWVKTMKQIQQEQEVGFPQYDAMIQDSNQ